jgi:hypothetical protein
MANPIPPPSFHNHAAHHQQHVPVTLNADDGIFQQWRSFFELTFKKFGLVNHIDGTVDAATKIDDPEWLQIDSCIVSWLYSIMST